MKHCAQTHVLGPDVEIEIEAFDECNNFVNVRAHRQAHSQGRRRHGRSGRRAVATSFRARSISAASFARWACRSSWAASILSGRLAMLPKILPEMQEAMDLGIHLFSARPRAAWLTCCATSRTAQPVDLQLPRNMPDLSSAVPPILPSNLVRLGAHGISELRCRPRLPVSVQLLHHHRRAGSHFAYRSADDVEAIVRANAAQGVTRFSSPTKISPGTATGKPSSTG